MLPSKQRPNGVKIQNLAAVLGSKLIRLSFLAVVPICFAASEIRAQRIAVVTPDKAISSERFAVALGKDLSTEFKVLDSSLVQSAYRANAPAFPFNLSTQEVRNLGSRVGCDYIIILRAELQRRNASGRSDYYEAYAPIWLFSSRSGRLIYWRLARHESTTPSVAVQMLDSSTITLVKEIAASVRRASDRELSEEPAPAVEEVPETYTSAAGNFRPPIPFRRVKPLYTADASFYDVAATVDILADIAADGTILRTEMVRTAASASMSRLRVPSDQ